MSESEKPEIEYPCAWEYSIMGTDEVLMRAAIAQAIGADTAHEIKRGNQSKSGKYTALRLALTVTDDAHRLGIYDAIKQSEHVKWVL